MRGRRPILVAILAIAAVAGGLLTFSSLPDVEPSHEEAIKRWPELVKNGFKGDRKLVARTFHACFRKGDNAQEYEGLLATAEKAQYPATNGSQVFQYWWNWDFGRAEGDSFFTVVTEGYPPVITQVYISAYVR